MPSPIYEDQTPESLRGFAAQLQLIADDLRVVSEALVQFEIEKMPVGSDRQRRDGMKFLKNYRDKVEAAFRDAREAKVLGNAATEALPPPKEKKPKR